MIDLDILFSYIFLVIVFEEFIVSSVLCYFQFLPFTLDYFYISITYDSILHLHFML